MHFVRPARLADLDELHSAHGQRRAACAAFAAARLQSARNAPRVALSEDSFRAEVDFPGEEFYLFELEDAASGRLLGTSSIVAYGLFGTVLCVPQ